MSHTTSNDRGASAGWRREVLLCVLAVVGGIAALVGLVGVLQLWWYLDRTTVAEVESMISQNLSPGVSTEEILAFCDSRDIDCGSVGRAEYNSVLLDAGFDPDTMVIGAFVHDTSRSLIVTGDIQIFFILDDDYRLKEYLVREVFTGF
jgi:hypothetical protein